MGFFKKYSYLRAIFIGIPFGIGCLVTGINQFKSIPNSINKLCVLESRVVSYEEGIYRRKDSDLTFSVLYVELENAERYYIQLGARQDIAKIKLDKENEAIVKIWFEKEEKSIEQLSINGEMLFEYKPPYWIAHVFFWVGLILLIAIAIGLYQNIDDFKNIYKSHI